MLPTKLFWRDWGYVCIPVFGAEQRFSKVCF
jgi:hypothetical protein